MVLFHVVYRSGSMCVGVTVWFDWGGVASLCRLKLQLQPAKIKKKKIPAPKG